jgi:hypothetical protein
VPRPGPLTEQERAEIRRRHAAGESRNAIAKALGRSGSTISGVIADQGGSFARGPEVVAATEARKTDLAARRAKLAEKLQDDAERLREQMWEPHTYFDWGGKDHDFDTHTAPEPTPADKRALISAVATAIDRSMKLVPPVDETGEDAARSMLGALAAGIAHFAGTDPPEEDAGEG